MSFTIFQTRPKITGSGLFESVRARVSGWAILCEDYDPDTGIVLLLLQGLGAAPAALDTDSGAEVIRKLPVRLQNDQVWDSWFQPETQNPNRPQRDGS